MHCLLTSLASHHGHKFRQNSFYDNCLVLHQQRWVLSYTLQNGHGCTHKLTHFEWHCNIDQRTQHDCDTYNTLCLLYIHPVCTTAWYNKLDTLGTTWPTLQSQSHPLCTTTWYNKLDTLGTTWPTLQSQSHPLCTTTWYNKLDTLGTTWPTLQSQSHPLCTTSWYNNLDTLGTTWPTLQSQSHPLCTTTYNQFDTLW